MGLLVGKTEAVIGIPLLANYTVNEYVQEIENRMGQVNTNTLVLTDIPGGTTTNVALQLTKKYPWKIISGVNSLMLLESILNQENELDRSILNRIVAAGKASQKILEVHI